MSKTNQRQTSNQKKPTAGPKGKQSQPAKPRPALTWVWIALAVLAVVSVWWFTRPDNPGQSVSLPREVSVAEAVALRDEGAFVLDVRELSEWTAGHIPGATLIPLGELSSRLAEVPANVKVVVVCRSGNRSAQGRDILLQAGYETVTSMAGGMNEWTAGGYPTVTGP